MPKIENMEQKHCRTVFDEMLGQGKVKGNLEYLSIIINIYLFLVFDSTAIQITNLL